MEKENENYRLLISRGYNVYSEQFIKTHYKITDIDLMVINKLEFVIQIKHGKTVNTTTSLKSFCYECNRVFPNAVKIWYTEYSHITTGFRETCAREAVRIVHNFKDLTCILGPAPVHAAHELRDYQALGKTRVVQNFPASGLLVFPPGCGKTLTALEIAHELYTRGKIKKILWTTRRKELLVNQFNDIVQYKTLSIFNMLTRNGKVNKITNCGLYVVNHDAIHENFPRDWDYVIVDECHESGAAEIFEFLQSMPCARLGLSATPYTGNIAHQHKVKHLFPQVFHSLNVFTAIEYGYCLPLEFWFKSDVLAGITQARAQLPWFKMIAWCNTIENCDAYEPLLHTALPGMQIFKSHSKSDAHNCNIKNFLNAANGVLICVNRAREGWNDPRVNCVAYLDAVQNRAFNVSIQTGNRCNRTYPGKTRAIVIDCVDRDPLDILLNYYFAYNPHKQFNYVFEHFSKHHDGIYYKSVKICEVFDHEYTTQDFLQQLQQKIYNISEYSKFCLDFQDIAHGDAIPGFNAYKAIILPDHASKFPAVPNLIYPKLDWYEVFGKTPKTVLSWNALKTYCRDQYAKYKPNNLHEFYAELAKNNNTIPLDPGNYYKKKYRNMSDLFGTNSIF